MKMHKVIALALLLGAGVYLGSPVTFEAVTPSAGDAPLAASSTNVAPETQQAVVQDGSTPTQPVTATTQPKTFQAFDAWMEKAAVSPVTPDELEEGLQLAQARKTAMQSLMRTNPAQALAQAVSLKEYAALPETIKPYVEKPFSERVDIMILPDESGLNPQKNKPRFDPNRRTVGEQITLTFKNHESLTLVPHGSRAGILSKDGLATQGIALDDVAIIHPAALQVVQAEDADYIQKTFPARTTNTQHDFFTGETIQGEPVMALAGGQVFYFASAVNVERLNLKLAELEQQTGPKVGSQILFQLAETPASVTGNTASSSLSSQINQLLAAPSPWTTTPKKVYFIRAVFPDKLDVPVAKSRLETVLQETSDNMASMSQGKTRFDYTVNADSAIPTLSNNTAYYYNNGSFRGGDIYNDTIAAFNALNTGVNLSSYDIIGVYFGINHPSAAGVATVGGSKMWIYNYDSTFVFTHEGGHNYGLFHAHSWNTTDGSVVGSGATEDYGDIYDTMGANYDSRSTFHPQARDKLGWLETSQWQSVTTSGTYRIQRFDHTNASGNRALRISRGGTNGHYWVSHRQNFDSNKVMENGLYLQWQQNGATDGWLLDTTPNSADGKNDAAIVLGKTYSDAIANIHITPVNKGGASPDEWVDVRVNMAVTGNTAPVVSGINGSISVAARQDISFSANASDAENDELAYYWDFGDGVINPNLGTVTHKWAVGGTYTVKLTVSDMKGGVDSTQISVTVTDPLNVWNSRASNSTGSLRDIASDGNKLAVVASNGEILTSNDASTWSKTDLGGNVRLYGVYYTNGLWVVVGDDYRWNPDGWVGVIYTSTDTVTWTRRHFDTTISSTLLSVAYGNGSWVAVGNNGRVLNSTNGVTWTSSSSGTTEHIKSVAYGSGTFVAVTNKGGGRVLTSTDGIAWADPGTMAMSSWKSLYYIDYLSNRFITSGFYAGIRYSTDGGMNFQSKQPDSQSTPANAYAPGLFFSAGVNAPQQGDETDINLVSTDGENWNLLTTASQPNRNAAVFFKNTFVTVGESGSIYQSGFVSSDTTPDAFSFTAKMDVALNAAVVSAPVQILGIDSPAAWTADNGEACVSSANDCNCGVAGFAASGTVTNNQYMCVRHTASNNYASSVSSTLTVGGISGSFGSTTLKNSQTITFGALSDKTLGTADFNISATASSNLTVSFSSQTPTVCTVAGTSVHLVAAGTCTIRASQAGNSTYNAAADVDRSFTVSPVAVNGSCGNDNDATLTSQPTNLCTVGTASSVTTGNSSYNWSCTGLYSGSTANCSATRHYSVTSSVNGGNGTISASQTVAYQATPSFTLTPNSGYVAGSVTGTCGGTLSGNTFTTNAVTAGCTVVASFVAKSNQTITFADLSNKILGDADFNISATASSNLTVSFSSQTPTVCTV
ncbi:MAG TPA: PKD domain-containing protein, partial [Candidatus Thiothrix moscowensis]|nr:PKD domain-containing protein [Candidatus Thiothrix moscowensis]